MKAKKYFLLLLGFLHSPIILVSQPAVPLTSNQAGFERTIRSDNNWDWGTCGHGSFDDAVILFGAEKEVMTYTDGRVTYRVFTRGNKNYVEMNSDWFGGVFTYTTNADSTLKPVKVPDVIDTKQTTITSDIQNKVIRKNGNWSWGTYGHGNFDQAARILAEIDNVVSFTDPTNIKIKYRVFSHGSLNYVEVDYGWSGGVFTYTINR
ncbi:MAG: hypothetical protein A3F72_09265 [Bacteroidetes bacterium RIFCSPLOWO2_12_FULL_35_15]|nr:MAG: hypothetical protein A3F72_09265 [Bacteroidetes bacterium RIFCSPLOWO2_12_FULL_35_15]